jgi:hypothetical protein
MISATLPAPVRSYVDAGDAFDGDACLAEAGATVMTTARTMPENYACHLDTTTHALYEATLGYAAGPDPSTAPNSSSTAAPSPPPDRHPALLRTLAAAGDASRGRAGVRRPPSAGHTMTTWASSASYPDRCFAPSVCC